MDYSKIAVDGGILAIATMVFLLGVMRFSPRLFLNKGDLPADILAAVPPKSRREKRLSILIGIPFVILSLGFLFYSTVGFKLALGENASFPLLFAHTTGVLLLPFLADLVILDWIVFCTMTPEFVIFPGTRGLAGYKDYMFHLKAHAWSLLALIPGCALIAAAAGLVQAN